jgi:formylmethanofuran dehydrogenase subunit C
MVGAMSDTISLTLRMQLAGSLDLEGLTPQRCLTLGEREIAGLPVWLGGREVRLGDLFAVRGERADRIHIEGDLRLATHVAAGMSGGEVIVDGNVGDDAGAAIAGGMLFIHGSAGARLGAARPGAARGMTGGEIVVRGAAGPEAGARARRGLIVVGGDAGRDAARAMIAGTVVVLGRTGDAPGRGNKRGSIIAAGGIEVPATYRYACTYQPPHLPLTMIYLRRRYGLSIDDRLANGRYARYCGDAGDPGKGEILVLDGAPTAR